MGTWISFEGIEGSGKTSQVRRLAERLSAAGAPVTFTREPGGTPIGHGIRAVLLDPASVQLHPTAELLLYAADRAQHLGQVILPALERGEIVLCDRYVDATFAYQGYGRGLSLETIAALHAAPPLDARPRRTLLFDLDPEVGLARARARNAGDPRHAAEGRFEEESIEFHRRVRAGYLRLAAADPGRIHVIDGSGSAEEVERRVTAVLADLLPPAE